jgi:hypothetical protein
MRNEKYFFVIEMAFPPICYLNLAVVHRKLGCFGLPMEAKKVSM